MHKRQTELLYKIHSDNRSNNSIQVASVEGNGPVRQVERSSPTKIIIDASEGCPLKERVSTHAHRRIARKAELSKPV